MADPLVPGTDPGGDACRTLAMPEHAWTKRMTPGRRFAVRRMFAVAFCVVGALAMLGSIQGTYRLPAIPAWFDIVRGLAWIGVGVGTWRGTHTLLRRGVALLLMAKGAAPLAVIVSDPSVSADWSNVGSAIVWIGLGAGVWAAQEWARWCCGVWALWIYGNNLVVGSLAVQFFPEPRPPAEFMVMASTIGFLVTAAPPAALAIYSVLPSTKAHFAAARDAIAGPRAVPA